LKRKVAQSDSLQRSPARTASRRHSSEANVEAGEEEEEEEGEKKAQESSSSRPTTKAEDAENLLG